MADFGLLATPFLSIEPRDPMVTLAPPRSLAGLACQAGKLASLQAELATTLPAAGKLLRAQGLTYLWSGPETWLVLAERDDPDFVETLSQRAGSLAAVTDQSDGRAVLRVQGEAAREALRKLLPIDLHADVFTGSSTALTLAGHINVQVWREDDGFALACFSSFCPSLYEALCEACGEFTGAI